MAQASGNISFAQWLDAQAKALGLDAAGCLKFGQALASKTASLYSDEALSGMPEYVRRDRRFKISPADFAPWAKSIIVAAGSFRALPPAPTLSLFKMADPDSPTAGLVAGYELRLDYHIHTREAMEKLADALDAYAGGMQRSKAICDANPLPERAFGIAAGLGSIGLHRCLLASSTRDGVFIAGLLTELELPERIFPEDAASLCNRCGACVTACPNKVLDDEKLPFDCSRCASALCSEFRGELDMAQVKSMGLWLAGCGECVRACPRSKLPPPEAIDLDWLLNCPAQELERALAPTPLAHNGPTLLRRNALSALFNRGKPESFELIRKFGERTGSSKLKAFAERLLKCK